MALRHSDSLPVSLGYLAVSGYDLRIARFSSVFVGALHGYWLILAISLVLLVDILPMEADGCSWKVGCPDAAAEACFWSAFCDAVAN